MEAGSTVPSDGDGATLSLQLAFDYDVGYEYDDGSSLLPSPPLLSSTEGPLQEVVCGGGGGPLRRWKIDRWRWG